MNREQLKNKIKSRLKQQSKEQLIETLVEITLIQFDAIQAKRLDIQKQIVNDISSLQCQAQRLNMMSIVSGIDKM